MADTEDCTGPSSSDLAFLRLSEKNYEYTAKIGGAV